MDSKKLSQRKCHVKLHTGNLRRNFPKRVLNDKFYITAQLINETK